MIYLALLFIIVMTSQSHAASLIWECEAAVTVPGSLLVEKATAPEGPFGSVATIPSTPCRFPLTPGEYGYYRLTIPKGPSSQVVRFFAEVETGQEARLSIIEEKVAVLETPPLGNISGALVDADNMMIKGTNCKSLSTSGTGTTRMLTCNH